MTEAAAPIAEAAAADRAYQMVGLKVEDDGTVAEATGAHWAISTTAKDDVLNAIKQAIKENWTPTQLKAVIQASEVFSSGQGRADRRLRDHASAGPRPRRRVVGFEEGSRIRMAGSGWRLLPGLR